MSDDGILEQFVNTRGDSGAGFKLADIGGPDGAVDWLQLAKATFASLLTAAVVGWQTTINALTELPAELLESAARWLSRDREVFRYPGGMRELWGDGLVATVESGILGVIEAAWSPLEGLGWLAYPVAAAEVLVSLYVVIWAISYVREEVL